MPFIMNWINWLFAHSLWGLGLFGLTLSYYTYRTGRLWWRQTPTIWLVYSLTVLLLALIQDSHWRWIYLFRYFIYLASGLLMFFIPLIFLSLIALMLLQLRAPNRESRGKFWWSNLIILLSLAILISVTVWFILHRWQYDLMRLVRIYVSLALYLIANSLAFAMIVLYYRWRRLTRTPDVLVILGTEVDQEGQVSEVLQERLNRALIYLQQAPLDLPIVVTGGLVQGLPTTEAYHMAQYLMAQGISPRRIWMEDRSVNTAQNIQYTLQLLGQSQHWLIVTSNFHLLRTAHYTYQAGVRADWIGSSTPWYLWPYSLAREYIAFILLSKEIHFVVAVLIVIYQLIVN